MPPDGNRSPGRPRDTTIDARALAATRELLVEAGLDGTTVQAVALRSGLHASAIYRRWPTRLDLVHDAAFADLPPGRVRPTGLLRDDLRRFLTAYVETFQDPVVRAAAPSLIADAARGRTERAPRTWAHLSVRPQFREILAAAPAEDVDPGIDPDEVFDLVLGAVLVRIVVPTDVRRPTPIDATVDLLVRALRPA
ncbi:MAG TPA: TetR/AcrR family transcriptional regulator [Acidimicrobiales bacterium]|nr:TetR/AcrR family transcriptional regulator [Acidimicrobiales bacterium]